MKYALIGCGMISPNHIKAALQCDLDIVALCDIVEENRTKAFGLIPEEKRSVTNLYADYNKMLEEQRPDLVAIALGSGLKCRVSIDCMRAGANVIVEKPIALSLSEADEMIKTSKDCNVLLTVNHQLRFGKTVRAMKAAVDNNYFGKLFHGTVQVRRNRNEAYFNAAKWRGTWAQDGGTLMNQCIHYTDLLQWVMGSSVEEVFAYTDRLSHDYIEAEDMGLAVLKFKNGAYGLIEGTVNVYPKNLSDTMALFGENGTISLSGKGLDEIQAWDFSDGPSNRDDAIDFFEISDMGEGHVPIYKDMISAIEKHQTSLCSPEEGRKALELILAIYQSSLTGQPVKLPLQNGATTDSIGRFDKVKVDSDSNLAEKRRTTEP